MRRLAVLVPALLLLLAACATQQFAAAMRQGNMLVLTPTAFSGFYGEELSSSLPGATGPVRRLYRWTRAEAVVTLWSAPATGGVVALEYHNPLGPARLAIAERTSLTLPPTERLRHARVLFPPSAALQLRLTQTTPQLIAERQLGVLVSDVSWSALGFAAGWPDINGVIRLLFGLPLTLALLYALARVLRLPTSGMLALLLLTLGGSALVATRWPWFAQAMQPSLQCLAWAALLGLGMRHIWRRRPTQRWTALLVGVWGLSLLLFFSPDISSDGVGYYAYLRSFFIDGDLQFRNEFSHPDSPLPNLPSIWPTTPTGHIPNPWSVGPALYWTPFWLVGHALTYAGRSIGLAWQADGYAPPYLVLTTLATALAGLATMLGCFRLARRWYAPEIAALTAITIYAGSNLLFYALFAGGFAHSLSAATVTGFLLAVLALDDRPTLRNWLLLGLTTGVMLLTYWITALLLLLPFAVALRHGLRALRERDGRALGRLALGGLAAAALALLVFFPQMLAWKIIFGDWLTIPQGTSYARPQEVRLLTFIFGPLYGLPWWTPAYFVGLLGCLWLAARRPWPGLLLLAAVSVYILYNTSLPDWHGSGAYGMRRLSSLAPLFALGLAQIFASARRFRALPALLAAVIIVWCLRTTMRYVIYELPRSPFAIRDSGLRTVLLAPEPFPFAATAYIVQHSWFGVLLSNPTLGAWMILGVGLALGLAAAGIVASARHWRRGRGADTLTR